MSQPLRILIVDDHPVVRRGVREILEGAEEVGTIAEADNAADALGLVRRGGWDAIILDITLPGRGGLDLMRQLKREWPALPVLILSMHPEEHYAVRTLRGGADAYLTKGDPPERLLEAVRTIVAGRKYVTASVGERLALEIVRRSDRPVHETLSDREFEVFRLIALGNSVGQIAAELALSVKTVSTYRARILVKTGLQNNAELMRYAIEHRIVE